MVNKESILWEASFILEGIPLPKDAPMSMDKFSFERLSGKEFENLWLPTLAKVEFEAPENENISEIGKRLLQDFIGLFTLEINYAIRIVRDEGYESKTRKRRLKALPSTVLHFSKEISPELFRDKLKIANQNLRTIDFSCKRNAYLRTALDYLLYSGESSRKEERLINLVIALEALFCEELDELSYRISHRVASMLDEDGKQRAQIFKDMREIYIERSKIVHKGYSSCADDQTWKHIKKAREFVIRSIKKFLMLAPKYTKSKILEKLDVAIFDTTVKEELFGLKNSN